MHCETHHKGMKHHGCCCGPTIHRHFLSKEERIERLKHYKTELEKEIIGIKEAIEQLQK
jgi:hypothetical protein